MGNLKWKPARTADRLLDRNFNDLADKLSGIDDLLSSVALPSVSRISASATVKDEDFVEYRGRGGDSVQLPPGDDVGNGIARVVYLQNNGAGSIQLRAQGKETINGLSAVTIPAGSMALAFSNGAQAWQALVTTSPVARAGHIIQDAGTDKTQRNHLNFVGATVADDLANDRTTITITSGTAGHVIQDNGSDQTQRAKLDFIGFTVADDLANNRTKVTAPASNLAGHVIQDNGSVKTQRASLDFIDTIVTDDGANTRTKVQVFRPDFQGIYLAGSWYMGGIWAPPTTDSFSIGAGGGVNQNFLYAYPVYFGRAGTINKLGQFHSGGTGSGGCKSWQAIYSANAAGDGPDQRLADFEQVSTGFSSHTETTINLAVAAGTVLWFAIVLNTNEEGNGYPSINQRDMYPCLGTSYPGVTGAGPVTAYRVGYRVSQAYGRPPSTWTGTTKLVRGTTSGVPGVLYTFTPT